jgi:AraC-like DNA-binding protein
MERRGSGVDREIAPRGGATESVSKACEEWPDLRGIESESARLWTSVVDSYLRRCLERQSPPRVKELAALLHLSRDQLGRAFSVSTGVPISQHFRRALLEFSKSLLSDRRSSVTMIAYKAGFERRRTFYRFFRRMTGKTPGEFRSRPPNVPRNPGS